MGQLQMNLKEEGAGSHGDCRHTKDNLKDSDTDGDNDSYSA